MHRYCFLNAPSRKKRSSNRGGNAVLKRSGFLLFAQLRWGQREMAGQEASFALFFCFLLSKCRERHHITPRLILLFLLVYSIFF
jgi:hypothetical protein